MLVLFAIRVLRQVQEPFTLQYPKHKVHAVQVIDVEVLASEVRAAAAEFKVDEALFQKSGFCC